MILNAAAIERALTRIAHEIAERNENSAEVALVGIHRGGVYSGPPPGCHPRRHLVAGRAGGEHGRRACTGTTWTANRPPPSNPQ